MQFFKKLRGAARAGRDLRAASAETGVSVASLLRDLLYLNLTRKMGVRAYFNYRLFDPRLTMDQKSEYLPDSHWGKQRLWGALNPQQYRFPFANKLIFGTVFGGAGLPVPRTLGVFDREVGYSADGKSLKDASQLEEWLQSNGNGGFVFKPVWGTEGYQILVFSGRAPDDPRSFVTLSGERHDAESMAAFTKKTAPLLGHPHSYLIQELIHPHPELARFVGPTLCCVRIVTLIGFSEKPTILGAVYKLQPEPLGVDHLSHGALGCWVDLESGALGPGRSRHHLGWSEVIPGTDKRFVGFELPDWNQVKNLAVKAASVFPWARSIGWDIAISDRGPVLIEGNAHWSPSLLQIPAPRGLMTGELKAVVDALGSARTTPA
jgi:putative polysaccharide biosynthesis protein